MSLDARLVVFVHGYRDDAETWRFVRARLEGMGLATLAIKLCQAGLGQESAQILDHYAMQVLSEIGKVAPTKRFLIVGHSMGAQVAELAASQLPPKRLAGLVLVTPAPLAGYALPEAEYARFAASARQTNPANIEAAWRALSPNAGDAGIAELVRATLNTSEAFALEQLRAWTGGHPAGQMSFPLNVPVLIIAAEQDFFFTKRLIRDTILPRFRNPAFEIIDESGHWAHVENPRLLAMAISRFASRLSVEF
ncbi:alpha/beta fold hydrolase [Xanthobacter sp. YC-JY1]|nr:alpha/beta hydrolase [Xanthobacter sp. YC-JY1]